ncbi:hypothetical protein CASFOL_019729 [Castilleja foliolosa]|uniref:Uncharacterized protein n=1 Tax=Castilleja foliolosa TaxID=1961234 RepID=A0ABD3D0C6_9LAMI
MSFLRCFVFVLVLIVVNFSYNVKARPLTKDPMPLSENDSTPLDINSLGPLTPICIDLLGSECDQYPWKRSNPASHLPVEDVQRKTESRAVNPSYPEDEKIPPDLLCSLLGGCEQSMTTSKSIDHLATKYVPSKKELTTMEPSNLEDEKIPPEVLCSLLGGCEESIKTSKSTTHLTTKDSNGIKESAMVSHLRDEKIPPEVLCSLLGGC